MGGSLLFSFALGIQLLSMSTNILGQKKDEATENIEACLLDCFDFIDTNHTRCEFELPAPLNPLDPRDSVELTMREPCTFEGVSSNPANLSFICMYSELSMTEKLHASTLVKENFCTHIVLDDFTYHSARGPVERPDSEELLEALTIFKAAGLKILMQVGAYRVSSMSTQPGKFSELASTNSSRSNYVRRSLEIVKKRGFDGVSIHWFYPSCPNYFCIKNNDKQNFVLLVEEYNRQFKKEDESYLISAILPPKQEMFQKGIDIVPLSKALDWMFLITNDFQNLGSISYSASVPDVAAYMKMYLKQVQNPRKLVPLIRNCVFGFEKVQPKNYRILETPASTGKKPNGEPITEMCSNILFNNYTVVRSSSKQNYAYKNGHWFSFDDNILIQKKIDMWIDMQVGGVLMFFLEWDDPENKCGCGSFPQTKSFLTGLTSANKCLIPQCV